MHSPALAAATESPSRFGTPASPLSDPWDPLPPAEWDADAARHLLRRAAWTATPRDVDDAVRQGLQGTLNRLFPEKASAFPKPRGIAAIEADEPAAMDRIRSAPEGEKRQLRKELRDRAQLGYQELCLDWLQFASDASRSAAEKWVLFLSDVYVVAFQKVRNPARLYQHHAILRENAFGSAAALAKAVSRSPAMIDYLDLRENKKSAPNENFARELFELFLLGEGHYSEKDIKEAARAFTGYRHRFGTFHFIRAQHDRGPKTVFGKSGDFDGDAVIDLAFKQPAARTFLPQEFWRFYVSDRPIPEPEFESLGAWWQGTGFDLGALARRVFGSRLFFAPEHRGSQIKSPVQFYLAAIQDLQLDVAPLPRRTLGLLRQMGQMPFNPPNVRGWVGGRSWINSSSLAARRQLVQSLFAPINEAALNADEVRALEAARGQGRARFTVASETIEALASASGRASAEKLVRAFLPVPASSGYVETLTAFLNAPGHPPREKPLRAALLTLLDSPEYQLC